jgi:hypothetical protein
LEVSPERARTVVTETKTETTPGAEVTGEGSLTRETEALGFGTG